MQQLSLLKTTCLALLLSLQGVFTVASACSDSTLLDSTPDSQFEDQGDGTIIDTLTSLMWSRCSEGQTWDAASVSCTGTAETYTWQEALQQVEDVNNSLSGFAGYNDWRLPNVKEYVSIMDEECSGFGVLTINETIFPDTYYSYWSSSPAYSDSYAYAAWEISFESASYYLRAKTNTHAARLVRDSDS